MSRHSPALHVSSLRLGNLRNHAQPDCLHEVPHMALRDMWLPSGYQDEGLTAGSELAPSALVAEEGAERA